MPLNNISAAQCSPLSDEKAEREEGTTRIVVSLLRASEKIALPAAPHCLKAIATLARGQFLRLRSIQCGPGSGQLVEEEINGGNPAVPGDDEIRSGICWRIARAARYPWDPPSIAQFLGLFN